MTASEAEIIHDAEIIGTEMGPDEVAHWLTDIAMRRRS